MENSDGEQLFFPEPVVIYLDSEKGIPEESTLEVKFGEQGTFIYKVKNFVYQEHDLVELNQKKLVVLIPFQLLKLKRLLKEKPAADIDTELRHLVQDDIIGTIVANLQVGNITEEDASQLRELTIQLYDHFCRHNERLGRCQSMRPLLDGALELPMDKYRKRIDELEEEKAKVEEQKAKVEEEKAKVEARAEKAEQEIERLRRLLEEAQGKNR